MRDNDENKLHNIALRFETALEKNSEEEIHKIIAANPSVFFPNFYTIGKYKLAGQYITDFTNILPASRYNNDPRARIHLIEIERADFPLFTNAGNPSSQLTHAIRQVQDWKLWIHNNRSYFQRQIQNEICKFQLKEGEFTNVNYGLCEYYFVIIGRRNTMKIEDRLRLAQMNDDLDSVFVLTYDMFLDDIVAATSKHGSIDRIGYWVL